MNQAWYATPSLAGNPTLIHKGSRLGPLDLSGSLATAKNQKQKAGTPNTAPVL